MRRKQAMPDEAAAKEKSGNGQGLRKRPGCYAPTDYGSGIHYRRLGNRPTRGRADDGKFRSTIKLRAGRCRCDPIRAGPDGMVPWSPKTGQVGKRQSSLGTAVWPEVRLVEYTEEAHCGVQGEGRAGGDPGGWHGCRIVEPVWCACQPDSRLEEDAVGGHSIVVCAGQGCGWAWRGERGAVGSAV